MTPLNRNDLQCVGMDAGEGSGHDGDAGTARNQHRRRDLLQRMVHDPHLETDRCDVTKSNRRASAPVRIQITKSSSATSLSCTAERCAGR